VKILSRQEAKNWCELRGIFADTGGRRVSLRYSESQTSCLQTPLDLSAGRLVALAHSLLLQDLVEPDAPDFAGVLVWFRDWDIWNESSESVGARVLECIRSGLTQGHAPLLQDGPAHLFTPQEFVDAHALLSVPILFQWDAYVVPESARCFTLVSHDAYARITARTATIGSRIKARFEAANWEAEECPPD
jgi:hypothetical protein